MVQIETVLKVAILIQLNKKKDLYDVNVVNLKRTISLFIQGKTSAAHSRPARNINLQFMRGEKVIKARRFWPAGLQGKKGFRQ